MKGCKMIFIPLSNSTSIILRLDEIKLVISHGEKSLVFTYSHEKPFCSSLSVLSILDIINTAIYKECNKK